MDIQKLVDLAIQEKGNSYSPYSNFQVGAALLTAEGKIYTGCNIENAAYTPTNCAERTAFFKAVSEGERNFSAIAIAGSKKGEEPNLCFPCGVCRQVMAEFCVPAEFKIIIVKNSNCFEEYTLSDLLPFGFGPADLHKKI